MPMNPNSVEAGPHGQHASGPGTAPLAQFFIPAAASLQERRPRTLKHGDTFALFDHNGDVLSGPGSPEGIYHDDTRYLSHLYLTEIGRASCREIVCHYFSISCVAVSLKKKKQKI